MESTLNVTWEGNVPGLAEHRISLEHFGSAITQLLTAYRRIASNMLRDAISGEKQADRRLRTSARWLDLQIQAITEGSAGLSALAVLTTPPGGQRVLYEDLTQRAGVRLLEAIEAESTGFLRDSAVRKYLQALPLGVSRQRYEFKSNGHVKEISVAGMEIASIPQDLPHLLKIDGFIVSVGFEPGKPFVVVEDEGGKGVRCSATQAQVDQALGLRASPVSGLLVRRRGDQRLLNLWPSDRPPSGLSDAEKRSGVFYKWDGLLRRLAQ